MALNDSAAERARTAANDLAKKLLLEARADREFRELFRTIAADLAATVEETGSPPRADEYDDDIRGLLMRQNRRVSAAFTGQLVAYLEEHVDDEDDHTAVGLALIAAALGVTPTDLIAGIRSRTRTAIAAFNRDQANADAALISRTNQSEIDYLVARAREDAPDATARQIGRRAGKEFAQRGAGRAATIAATTTQKAAESAKDIERQQFFQVRNGLNAIVSDVPQQAEVEVWETIGDSVVREAHVAADETRKVDGFFTVGGEQLRYPGDPLGSPANVINCRCSAVLVFGKRADEAFVPEQIAVEPDDENTPAAFV